MSRDLFIEFNYSPPERSAAVLRTNIKESYINDFLAEVVHAQVGKGVDNRKANEFDVYNILIKCDLSYDHIKISSNTGNASLTTGIINNTINNWKFSESLLEQMAKKNKF